ncbi:hypothetical protein PPROV_000655100 [Pycnococcus provasolii]|uniref:J domain-containing protein n=1 Tax=Pycnococcus provasolii TaxID=41880 RepID=A0A830HS49_9CHLO|nr:hypothetical protein PPROV_000655100 [Pycnococcus provasolii]
MAVTAGARAGKNAAAPRWTAGKTTRGCHARRRRRKHNDGHVVCKASASTINVDFPTNEDEQMAKVHTCVQACLSDGYALLEVEFPLSSGLGINSGDTIAIAEYNAQQGALRRFCALFEWLGQSENVRVFFPDAAEASIAMQGAGLNPVSGQWAQEATFDDWNGDVDYLVNDDLFSQASMRAYGISQLPEDMAGKMAVEGNARVDDRLYVIGYPYDSSDELVQVMKLWKAHARRTIIFNGNLDSIRSGWFPWGDGKKLKEEFVPTIETAYYVHVFKGAVPGVLYRAYPGKWQVLRARVGGGLECVEEYDARPELKEVALKYFSGGLTSQAITSNVEPAEPLSDDNQAYYDALGVARDASSEELASAYRSKARALHPDVAGTENLSDFYAVSKAYAVLKDPEKRVAYDEYGERWVDAIKEEKDVKAAR